MVQLSSISNHLILISLSHPRSNIISLTTPATMRFSFAVATALLGLASANFDLYAGADNMLGSGNQFSTWYIHEAPPDCNRVTNHAEMWDEIDDVSGDKRGIRCEGMGCHRYQPENVDVLEMHFSNNPLYHWSKFHRSVGRKARAMMK
jgi:hypothetical protein